jgi:hypothetical protein
MYINHMDGGGTDLVDSVTHWNRNDTFDCFYHLLVTTIVTVQQ